MSEEWIYPWPAPSSVYDSGGPREGNDPLDFERFGAKLRITPTKDTGINSGRRRYKVECLTCDEVMHPATTGPRSRFDQHLEAEHGKPRKRYGTP